MLNSSNIPLIRKAAEDLESIGFEFKGNIEELLNIDLKSRAKFKLQIFYDGRVVYSNSSDIESLRINLLNFVKYKKNIIKVLNILPKDFSGNLLVDSSSKFSIKGNYIRLSIGNLGVFSDEYVESFCKLVGIYNGQKIIDFVKICYEEDLLGDLNAVLDNTLLVEEISFKGSSYFFVFVQESYNNCKFFVLSEDFKQFSIEDENFIKIMNKLSLFSSI